MYRIEYPSKWYLVEKNMMKHVKVVLGQSSVDFSLKNPNLVTFDFWWILSFLDESWSNLDKMMNLNSKCLFWPKILKLDYKLVKVDFLRNIVDFQSSD